MSEVPTKIEDITNIAQARQYASANKIPLPKTATFEQAVGLIKEFVNGPVKKIHGTFDTDLPPPGYARLTIDLERDPKSSNADVYCQVNGYSVLIKRGVKADVPIKILHCLENAQMEVFRESREGTGPGQFEMVYSYPFKVHAVVDGPDPKPGFEKTAAARNAPRRRFRDKKGYWPKPKELKEWLSNGSRHDED